jgi:hypothetical protein
MVLVEAGHCDDVSAMAWQASEHPIPDAASRALAPPPSGWVLAISSGPTSAPALWRCAVGPRQGIKPGHSGRRFMAWCGSGPTMTFHNRLWIDSADEIQRARSRCLGHPVGESSLVGWNATGSRPSLALAFQPLGIRGHSVQGSAVWSTPVPRHRTESDWRSHSRGSSQASSSITGA